MGSNGGTRPPEWRQKATKTDLPKAPPVLLLATRAAHGLNKVRQPKQPTDRPLEHPGRVDRSWLLVLLCAIDQLRDASAVPWQCVGAVEGARRNRFVVVLGDIVEANAGAGEVVARPRGTLSVEELNLRRPGKVVVCRGTERGGGGVGYVRDTENGRGAIG